MSWNPVRQTRHRSVDTPAPGDRRLLAAMVAEVQQAPLTSRETVLHQVAQSAATEIIAGRLGRRTVAAALLAAAAGCGLPTEEALNAIGCGLRAGGIPIGTQDDGDRGHA